jgi:hypothetical protein
VLSCASRCAGDEITGAVGRLVTSCCEAWCQQRTAELRGVSNQAGGDNSLTDMLKIRVHNTRAPYATRATQSPSSLATPRALKQPQQRPTESTKLLLDYFIHMLIARLARQADLPHDRGGNTALAKPLRLHRPSDRPRTERK